MIDVGSIISRTDNSIQREPPTTPLQESFLARWKSYFPGTTSQTFLRKWMHAFEAYGTPLELLSDGALKKDLFSINGRHYQCWHWHSDQVEAMAKVCAERTDYTSPVQALHEKEAGRMQHCHLCQNVTRAVDCENGVTSIANNLILKADKHLVFPNRYGLIPGESLLIPESHDDMQSRVPIRWQIQGGRPVRRVACEAGKTRGRILSVEDITAACTVADELQMAWSRNHPCSGMSIPEHDHFHLWPRRFIPLQLVVEVAGTREQPTSQLEFCIAENSPISILTLTCTDRAALIRAAHGIFSNLERGDQAYITSYLDGRIFICPIKLEDDRCVRVPSLIGMHNIMTDSSAEKNWGVISPSLYERDEFPWRDFL